MDSLSLLNPLRGQVWLCSFPSSSCHWHLTSLGIGNPVKHFLYCTQFITVYSFKDSEIEIKAEFFLSFFFSPLFYFLKKKKICLESYFVRVEGGFHCFTENDSNMNMHNRNWKGLCFGAVIRVVEQVSLAFQLKSTLLRANSELSIIAICLGLTEVCRLWNDRIIQVIGLQLSLLLKQDQTRGQTGLLQA